MNKYLLIFLSLILVLLIAGCVNRDEGPTGAYIGGNDGLIASFRPEEPPETILDEGLESYTVAVEVQNRGEDTVYEGEAVVILSGINTEDFGLRGIVSSSISINEDPIPARVKVGSDIMEPAKGEIIFDSSMGYAVDLEQDFSTKIRADLCYLYSSEAVSNLCLKYNPIQRRPELDICRIDASKSVENSGAPVHFENFKETRSGMREVRFSVDITNVGGGDVFAPEEYNDDTPCIEDLEPGAVERGLVKNRVFVEIVPQSLIYDIRCSRLEDSTQGYVKLVDGKARVDCVVNTERAQDTAFEVPVKFVATYSYRKFIEKPITVENARIRGVEQETGRGSFYT